MDPAQCRELIEGARAMHLMRGGSKGPAAEEQVTMDFAFATVVTIAPVREGEVFTEKNLWASAPGRAPFRPSATSRSWVSARGETSRPTRT